MNIELVTDKTAVIAAVDDPTPVAFVNLFEPGDIWIKTKGCEDCPLESRRRCCNQCPMLVYATGQCSLHVKGGRNGAQVGINNLNKPFCCMVKPIPSDCYSWCQLEYKCLQGSNEGKIRKVSEPAFGI